MQWNWISRSSGVKLAGNLALKGDFAHDAVYSADFPAPSDCVAGENLYLFPLQIQIPLPPARTLTPFRFKTAEVSRASRFGLSGVCAEFSGCILRQVKPTLRGQ